MLIDTHCHLDAAEFAADRSEVIVRAQQAGVQAIVIPAVAVVNFETVRTLAHSVSGGYYALGIHPLYALQATQTDLEHVDQQLSRHRHDPRLVGVGEIGLDYFVPELCTEAARAHQEWLFEQQLKLAQKHNLPVIVHVRRSQDRVLKFLRQYTGLGGIAHAFNGSEQQAEQFIRLGMALGFGGAMTFTRAKQIRRLAASLPSESIVLETDAPDIPPAWLGRDGLGQAQGSATRNEPAELQKIAQELASLRGQPYETVVRESAQAAIRALPGLRHAFSLTASNS
ncbi:TatD family hydrolase [Alcaligenes endophyticus]|uniref:TatD family hydrolase n=1 Tax=Alcaligenes endophyticus TaxID=1929088 RepID=A0ABT8EII7_9BURK|nr:TatD family hydrolase [Alcaligenes endophyticus]MCX5592553.1 TatD family hydrolase [Alcaligenes endophyticus]MDN4121099.1 TatD family hydrolase [Alcaligenes endophyticus]